METSNQYYGRMNDRFDGRSKRLRSLGFEYVRVDEFNLAIFTIKRLGMKQAHTIPAAAVSYAEDRAWNDLLEAAERYVA